MDSSLWRGASLTRAGRKFAVPWTYFASFVQSPCHLRSRPTREPCTLRSDTGIQSLIHSSSRLRLMLAPEHSTRRTCKMARRSIGLQFAIRWRKARAVWREGKRPRFVIGLADVALLLPRQLRVGEVEKSPAATLGGGVKVDHEMLDRLRIAVYCRSPLLWSWPDSFGSDRNPTRISS